MKIKKGLEILLYAFFAVAVILLLVFLAKECGGICQTNYCSNGQSFDSMLNLFITDILRVLLAMLFWFISPIGVLLLLGIKLFFSENASLIRKNFALLLQFLSFLSWSSLMFILLVVYIDSVSYQVLNLGGEMLNLAIKSGFGFIIFMVILTIAEKEIIVEQKRYAKNKDEIDKNKTKRKNNGFKNEKKKKNSVKGIKNKIKGKIKEEIKEIIDDKIDKL